MLFFPNYLDSQSNIPLRTPAYDSSYLSSAFSNGRTYPVTDVQVLTKRNDSVNIFIFTLFYCENQKITDGKSSRAGIDQTTVRCFELISAIFYFYFWLTFYYMCL
uniref:Uncharacterized protein n=1 Tax=Heterorhabditis bacteriophora TaxID=37862 RepID=A0A1I7WR04_HETBA